MDTPGRKKRSALESLINRLSYDAEDDERIDYNIVPGNKILVHANTISQTDERIPSSSLRSGKFLSVAHYQGATVGPELSSL